MLQDESLKHVPEKGCEGMLQTANTAIVLRYANYRDNDRMLTLLSPTRGRIEAVARGCRKPKSQLLGASELFALGEFELYEKGGRITVTGASLTETFYSLRQDWDRLNCGIYLLSLCEAVAQPGQNAQELFMLLLHTLSRLTFTDQAWRPLISGFLLHFAAIEGEKPRLNHCVRCGRRLSLEEGGWFDEQEGGLCCADCAERGMRGVSAAEARWLRMALQSGSAAWVDTQDCHAPFRLLRGYVENRLERPIRNARMLPEDGSQFTDL